MKQKLEQIRIKDIAILAGVSAGTVDRVLHSRGEVSQESKDKVEKVLCDLNYKPNVYASALASKRKEHKFVYLMPQHIEGDYWDLIESGIKKAEREFSSINVVLQPVYFDQYNADTFKKAVRKVISYEPQAVLFAPVFREESISFLQELKCLNIPYVFFDSRIEREHALAYYGQDSFQSGYLACKMMMTGVSKGSDIALFYSMRKGNKYSNQTAARKEGFMKCVEDFDTGYKFHSIDIVINDELEAKCQIERFMREHPQVKGVVMFNSRSYLIGEYLQIKKRNDIFVIGFDALKRNISCMKEGFIQILIGQQPQIQGYKSVKTLCDAVIFKQPVNAVNFMPLDILTNDNIDYYCNFDYI